MHTVSFGPYNAVLRRITQIALDVQNNTAPDPNAPAAARVDSSYAEALDSVSLNQRLVFVRSHHLSGSPCRNLPWNCRVVEETERITFTMINDLAFCCALVTLLYTFQSFQVVP